MIQGTSSKIQDTGIKAQTETKLQVFLLNDISCADK
jgi:hypothetical protein